VLEQLRKPRYLALSAVMLLVATICIAAGTWQVFRFLEKHRANALLRHNAHAATVPVEQVLAATGTPGARARAQDGQFRRVNVAGSYDAQQQLLVRERTVDGTVGFLVLTPLRTAAGAILLVVRGFVAADGNSPAAVAPAPPGQVRAQARIEPPELRDDHFGQSAPGQITAINPVSAVHRLQGAVYDGYVELLDGQPGSQGLTPIPAPDLSNPAGGAIEPQHLAYVVQWYLFALLALAAPLVMARAEAGAPEGAGDDLAGAPEGAGDDLADAPESGEDDLAGGAAAAPKRTGADDLTRAKLIDRYGGARSL
jgi:cytochrome oxidase assembly protein ShyY1